jgi:hypothetical protein
VSDEANSAAQLPKPPLAGGRNDTIGVSTLAARAPTNRLVSDDRVPADPISRVASNVSVQDQIALSDAELRKKVAIAIVVTFIIANGIVLAGVWLMFNQEMGALQNKIYAASDV